MTKERFTIEVSGTTLVGERRGQDKPVVVMLHEGVADRRSWQWVAGAVADHATVVTYDRRGFGETLPSSEDFSHVDDLLLVIDAVTDGAAPEETVWLAGTSAGGGIALDAAIVAPERIAGLLLLAPAVSAAPRPELDPDTERFDRLIDDAVQAGDLDEVNRLETWLWLDGPSQAEGRVGGAVRALVMEMNAIALRSGMPEGAGASGVAAWDRLEQLHVPVMVACGDLDVPFLVERSKHLADRLPHSLHRTLDGVAHLSELEAPAKVTDLLCTTVELG